MLGSPEPPSAASGSEALGGGGAFSRNSDLASASKRAVLLRYSPLLLAALLAACAAAPPVQAPAPLPVANRPPPEATNANAGAPRCVLRGPVELGVMAPGGGFALGFGVAGGLAAWSSARGVEVRPVASDGQPRGEAVLLSESALIAPVEVVPVPGGFAVVSLRALRTVVPRSCQAVCPDRLEPDACWEVCRKGRVEPYARDLLVQQVDLAGRASSTTAERRIGPIAIEAVIEGERGDFGLLTGKELLTVRAGGMEIDATELPKAAFALPVRGEGPPSVLLLHEDGRVRLVSAGGVTAVRGSVLDEGAGQIIDARLQARWAADGKIHLARQAWLRSRASIRYAVIDAGALRFEGPPEEAFRAPFAEYLEPRVQGSALRRGTWLQETVGEPIDPRALDAEAEVGRAKVAWSGTGFVVAYRARSGPLRAIAASCDPSRQ
jgi:hypothetical protein